MKTKLLLLALFCISLQIQAQQSYCPFTYYVSPGTNTVTFSPNSYYSGGQYHYNWDFGDATSSTLANPVHTYSNTDPRLVLCFSYDAANNPVCTTGDTIFIIPPYSCGFSVGSIGVTDTFEFAAQPLSGAHIEWDFGDGSPTTTTNPVRYAYTQIGNYNCIAFQKDSLGNIICQHTEVMNVTSTHGCSLNYTNGSGNLVDFTSTAPASYSVYWDFGDSSSDTGHVTQHIYALAGSYNVCYTAYDNLGDTCHSCLQIHAGTWGVNCAFSLQPDSLVPTTVTFSDNVIAPNVHWDFGDGTIDSGSTVTHAFASTGLYFVCMTESDTSGITCQHCDSVIVSGAYCSFQATPIPSGSLFFGFDFSTSQGIYQIFWDFGDGISGIGANTITHFYNGPGLYQVCMSEIDSTSGSTVCTSCQWINVTYPASCQASFVSTSQGLTTYFIDQSSADSISWHYWYFGDGDSSMVRFPQHIYAMPGVYNVCHYFNDAICSASFCDSITVSTGNPTCQSLFAIVQMAPYQISIVNMSTGTSISYNWDFGDGSSDSAAYPIHFYNSTGSYNLCLTVSDGGSCNDTYCDTLNVDSLGNVFRYAQTGFSVYVISPSQITGVKNINTYKPLNVYPNPFGSELNISSGENDKIESYAVYSIQGKLISKGKITNGQGKIETMNYATGTYLLEVKLEDGSRNYRMVVKK